MSKKKLPIGVQSFREIREDNCYYVDKMAFALRLIEKVSIIFILIGVKFSKAERNIVDWDVLKKPANA